MAAKFLPLVFIALLNTFQAHADVWSTLKNEEEFNNPKENTLSFIFYRAPKVIDWKTPGAMVRSAIWNNLSGDRNPLSHIDALISCEGERSELTGMSSKKDFSLVSNILTGRQSLELLVIAYPGYLISAEEIRKEAPRFAELGRVNTFSIKISNGVCKRLLKFVAEYREREYAKIYAGFTANPFKGEGAGCAAFGMSLLQVAGLLEDEFVKKWSHRLNVPKSLMNYQSYKATKSFWDFMLFGYDGVWSKDKNEGLAIVAFDPELMYNWVAKTAKALGKWDSTARVVKSGPSIGIEVDRTKVKAPTDDYWSYAFPPVRDLVSPGGARTNEARNSVDGKSSRSE